MQSSPLAIIRAALREARAYCGGDAAGCLSEKERDILACLDRAENALRKLRRLERQDRADLAPR